MAREISPDSVFSLIGGETSPTIELPKSDSATDFCRTEPVLGGEGLNTLIFRLGLDRVF